jgi:ketosteroid isomerase-like protein
MIAKFKPTELEEDMPEELLLLGEAGQVLERIRAAAIARSESEREQLYAVDAVHEFPFTMPGVPSRLVGRDAIVEFIVASWKSPLKYERYETLSAYTTNDPCTVVVQQDVYGTSSTTGPFILPNLVVLTVAGGEIHHLRDFVNLLAAFGAMGMKPGVGNDAMP